MSVIPGAVLEINNNFVATKAASIRWGKVSSGQCPVFVWRLTAWAALFSRSWCCHPLTVLLIQNVEPAHSARPAAGPDSNEHCGELLLNLPVTQSLAVCVIRIVQPDFLALSLSLAAVWQIKCFECGLITWSAATYCKLRLAQFPRFLNLPTYLELLKRDDKGSCN